MKPIRWFTLGVCGALAVATCLWAAGKPAESPSARWEYTAFCAAESAEVGQGVFWVVAPKGSTQAKTLPELCEKLGGEAGKGGKLQVLNLLGARGFELVVIQKGSIGGLEETTYYLKRRVP